MTTEINEDVQMYTYRRLSGIIILVNKLHAFQGLDSGKFVEHVDLSLIDSSVIGSPLLC